MVIKCHYLPKISSEDKRLPYLAIFRRFAQLSHCLDMRRVSLEDLEQCLQALFSNVRPEFSEQMSNTTFDLQWTDKQLGRQIMHAGRHTTFGQCASHIRCRHVFRNVPIAPRGLAGNPLTSTEQSDNRGQDGDTSLDEETTELVCAHQKYLR